VPNTAGSATAGSATAGSATAGSATAGSATAPTRRRRHDVLVVGGGPAGSSAAYWLADAGWDVLLVERKHLPREKTCGDGLTPRSVRQLEDMGLADELAGYHRFDGLRSVAYGREIEMRWPECPGFPRHGYVVTRHDLDAFVAARAQKAGATLWQGAEAVAPLADGGAAGGALVLDKDSGTTTEVEARCVVVADGSSSRFGHSLGTVRDRSYPLGMALRGYYSSPRHAETWIESHLDIRDKRGQVVPGYGWIFPLGDGRVNVGIGLLSTFAQWKEVNTSHLMESFVEWAPKSWELSPETSLGAPKGGKLPMGFSIGPRSGPDWVVVGDAAGSINPFNGEGIAYGYETGRLAASSVGAALAAGDLGELRSYEAALDEHYDLYYRIARAFVVLIGRPQLMRAAVGVGIHSRSVMEWVMRVMANLLRPDELGPAEAAYAVAARLVARGA
jgi:geranylgeranyl reductase family protein